MSIRVYDITSAGEHIERSSFEVEANAPFVQIPMDLRWPDCLCRRCDPLGKRSRIAPCKR
jgi:hypothetical protein